MIDRINSVRQHRSAFAILIIAVIVSLVCLLIRYNCFFGITEDSVMKWTGNAGFSAKADGYPLSVHFIDVGNGESVLIICKDKAALIDTGSLSVDSVTGNYIRQCGIDHLDLFAASCMKSDYIGDFDSVTEIVRIDNIILDADIISKERNRTDQEEKLISDLSSHGIKILESGSTEYLLGDAMIQILTGTGTPVKTKDDSLVIRLVYGETSFLFTSDAGEKTEEMLIKSGTDIRSDVLGVGRHGSKSASSQEFLDAVEPEYAVISAGRNNKYLPDRNIIDRLNTCIPYVYRTDRDGTIIFACDGKDITVFCEHNTDE